MNDLEALELGIAMDEHAPVCEIGDLLAEDGATFRQSEDNACEGLGAWLLISAENPPSPLCDKHARLVQQRLGDMMPSLGVRLVRS